MPLKYMKPIKAEYLSQTIKPGLGENQYGTPFTIDEAESVTSRNLSSRSFPAMQVRPGRAAAFSALTTPNGIGARDDSAPHVLDGTVWKAWGGSVWNPIKTGLTSARAKFVEFTTGTTKYTVMSNGVERYSFANTATAAWVEKSPTVGVAESIYSMAAFNGKLYGGTDIFGRLLEWNGTDAWVEVAPQFGAEENILALAVFNGKLYGGSYPNGKLLEWNNVDAWVEKAPKLGAEVSIRSLAVFNGKLYGGTVPNGKLFEWNNSNAWVEVAPKLGSETTIESLVVFNNKIYGITSPSGKLVEWNGTNIWVEKAPQLSSQSTYSLAVYNNKLYAGTATGGKLLEWNGTNAWVEVAPQFSNETYIFSLAVHNGKLYAGTCPNGKLLEWNNSNAWVEKAAKSGSETYIYSLAVHEGKLYGGTYPSAKLLEWNGTVVTSLTEAPLTNLLAVHRFRLFALIGRELKFTAINLPNDWTTALQAGTITIANAKSDGTAIIEYANHLVFFTANSMHELHGTNYDNFQPVDISDDGCIAERTLIENRGVLYWLDQSEFKAYGGGKPVVISQKVQNYLKAMPDSYKHLACCGKLGKYIYLSIPYGTTTYNNLLLEYDTELKQWYPQTGEFVEFVNIGDKLYGVTRTGAIQDMESGTTDAGTAISWYKESGAYMKQSARNKKFLQNVHVVFDQPSGSTLTLATSETVDSSDFVTRKTFTADSAEQNVNTVLDANILGYTDWYRLKLAGTGPATVHMIEQVYRLGR